MGSIQIGIDMFLKDVLHGPEFQFNLLLGSKLTKHYGATTMFSRDAFLLQDHTLQIIVVLGK